jgi:hypothetical protein
MPRSACHMHSELLRKASYVLKTGAGISEQAYSLTESQPLCSEGQLELPKCFYYLLHWVCDSEGCARLATPNKNGYPNLHSAKRRRPRDRYSTTLLPGIPPHAGGSREPSWYLQNGIRASPRQRKQSGADNASGRMDSLPKHLTSQPTLQPILH